MTKDMLDSTAIASAIASAMQGAISRHSMELDDIKAEADAVQAKRDDEMVTREGTLRTLADMSASNGWTAKQVDAGAAIVASMGNGKLPASVKTFANELRVVMQPGTREAFPSIMNAALEVWGSEELARTMDGKDADTPARKAWKRRYHTIVAATQALPMKGRLLDTAETIVAYARECDPSIDVKKTLKRVAALMQELSGIAINFPEQDVKAAYDMLSSVTEASLTTARNHMLNVAAPTIAAAPMTAQEMKAAEHAERTTTPEPTPETADTILDGRKPMPGAVDLGALTTPYNGAAFQRAA